MRLRFKMLQLQLALAVIVIKIGYCQNSLEEQYVSLTEVVQCSEDCTEGDLSISWRECKERTIWDQIWNVNAEADCKKNPPIIAEKCHGCSKAVSLSDLNQVCNCESQFTELSGTLGNNVDCWAKIQSFDSKGNRMVFRHTGGEMGIREFFRFYRTGVRSPSMLTGCPGSQYLDPNLHFFWGETNKVVIDVFDVNDNHATYVSFTFPQGSMEHPQWDQFFTWDFLLSSEDQYYNDIRTAPHLEMYFEGNNMNRNLYIPSRHDACTNDKIWLGLLGHKPGCWDARYNNPDTTTVVYSPFKTGGHTLKLAVGNKLELRLGGDFVRKDNQNGYRKVLRYPNAAGVDFMDFYEKGVTNSSEDQ